MTDPTKVERLEVWICSCGKVSDVGGPCTLPGRHDEDDRAYLHTGPQMERVEVIPAQEVERLEQALRKLVEAADWYRRCLEDVIDRSPVRGLDEAKTGYDRALSQAREILGGDCPAGGEHVLAPRVIDGMTFPDECEKCGEPRPKPQRTEP